MCIRDRCRLVRQPPAGVREKLHRVCPFTQQHRPVPRLSVLPQPTPWNIQTAHPKETLQAPTRTLPSLIVQTLRQPPACSTRKRKVSRPCKFRTEYPRQNRTLPESPVPLESNCSPPTGTELSETAGSHLGRCNNAISRCKCWA